MERERSDEKGYDGDTGRALVEVDRRYFRPAEVDTLHGNPSKAKKKLGWNPGSHSGNWCLRW